MRSLLVVVCLLAIAFAAFAQSDRGTITGTVSDPAGAVVAKAAIEARNTETGAVYPVAGSATGNYTIAQVPAGTYELPSRCPASRSMVRPGLIVQAAQTIRVDAALEVGSATESVTVNAEAPLLKTESGELSQTIATQTMDALPLLSSRVESSGIRNPYNIVALLPGAYYQPSIRVHHRTHRSHQRRSHLLGNPAGRRHGRHQSDGPRHQSADPAGHGFGPGVDGSDQQLLGGIWPSRQFGHNVTMKSGTNLFHGSLYDYFQNEFLNAGQPFTFNRAAPTGTSGQRCAGTIMALPWEGRYGFPKFTTAVTRPSSFLAGSNSCRPKLFAGRVFHSHASVSQWRFQRRHRRGRQ